MTYTWNCSTVDAYPSYDSLSDVVYNVHWILSGEEMVGEDAYSASVYGTISISLEDLSPATFVPVDQLTNEVVTGWVKTAMGTEEVQAKEEAVASAINAQINPTSVTITIGA